MKDITIARKEDGSINALGPGDEGFPDYYGPNSLVRTVRITIKEDGNTWAVRLPISKAQLEDHAVEHNLIEYGKKWQPATK